MPNSDDTKQNRREHVSRVVDSALSRGVSLDEARKTERCLGADGHSVGVARAIRVELEADASLVELGWSELERAEARANRRLVRLVDPSARAFLRARLDGRAARKQWASNLASPID